MDLAFLEALKDLLVLVPLAVLCHLVVQMVQEALIALSVQAYPD